MAETAPYVAGSETSREAAEQIEASGHLSRLEREVYEFLARRGDFGATDEEIAQALGLDGSTARPRRVALVARGLVRDSGARGRTRSGRRAVVWVVTSEERARG